MRLSKEMENQAKKKGFITRMVKKVTGQTGPDETFLNADDMAASWHGCKRSGITDGI
jgi:hypothetical protein